MKRGVGHFGRAGLVREGLDPGAQDGNFLIKTLALACSGLALHCRVPWPGLREATQACFATSRSVTVAVWCRMFNFLHLRFRRSNTGAASDVFACPRVYTLH